jgi:hypothetical protein
VSAANQTKVFGMKLGVDPKILVGGLMAIAALLFWINSRGDEPRSATPSVSRVNNEPAVVPEPAPARARTTTDRRRGTRNDRAALKLKTVVPGSGDVDPVLHLDLLEKLAKVEPAPEVRNLFELEAPKPALQATAPVAKPVVQAPLPPMPVMQARMMTPQINIPLRYYGFAKPAHAGDASRGFFLEGDDVLVAAEGQTVKGQYRIVQLTPQNAVVQDTHAGATQTLPVTPEAMQQGNSALNQQNGMIQQQDGLQEQFPNGPPNQNEGNEP